MAREVWSHSKKASKLQILQPQEGDLSYKQNEERVFLTCEKDEPRNETVLKRREAPFPATEDEETENPLWSLKLHEKTILRRYGNSNPFYPFALATRSDGSEWSLTTCLLVDIRWIQCLQGKPQGSINFFCYSLI